jgi:hypothetical protein
MKTSSSQSSSGISSSSSFSREITSKGGIVMSVSLFMNLSFPVFAFHSVLHYIWRKDPHDPMQQEQHSNQIPSIH